MESYEKLKAFDEAKGRCCELITNEFAVAQFQRTHDEQAFVRDPPDYVLLYGKKMLLNPKTTVKEVRTQMIEVPFNSRMSINTTSLAFVVFTDQKIWNLRVLNFWVETGALDSNEQVHENSQVEKN